MRLTHNLESQFVLDLLLTLKKGKPGLALLLLVLLSACHAGSRSTPTDPIFPYLFTTGPSVLTGELPRDAVLVDLDDDGIPDLVTANAVDETLSIFIGVGDGTFLARTDINVGGEARSVFATDLNGDRAPDLLVALFNVSSVAVLLNTGTGTFATPLIVAVGISPNDVEVGDFNLDGLPDLVAANQGGGTLSIALGRGAGTFFASSLISVIGFPVALSIGDLNLDDLLDIAVASPAAGVVTVLLGDGTGRFPNEVVFDGIVATPSAVLLTELNGDGTDDLAIADLATNTVSILANDVMGSATLMSTFPVGQAPVAIGTALLPGDGLPDLIVANRGDDTISILNGKELGSLLTYEDATSVPVGDAPTALAIGDLDRDQDSDILVVAKEASSISILQSRLNENNPRKAPVPAAAGTSSIAIGNFNLDGHLDAATANTVDGTVSVFAGNGDGGFVLLKNLDVGGAPTAIDAADIDRDGIDDIAITVSGDNRLVVLFGSVDFQFDRRQDLDTDNDPRDVLLVDLNRDFSPDAVVVNRVSRTVNIFITQSNGTLVLDPLAGFSVRLGAQTVTSGDFNRDLIQDLFVANTADDSIMTFLGNVTGTFDPGPTLTFEVGSAPTGLTTGDFNGDVFLDLVVSHSGTGQVQILNGDGAGDFLRDVNDPTQVLGSTIEIFGQPRSMLASDLNTDGRLDLAICLFGRSSLAIATGDGIGGLSLVEGVDVGEGPSDVAFGDFNEDGQRDLATANAVSGTVSFAIHRADTSRVRP